MGKVKSGKYVKFCIYLVAVVLVNLAGITLFQRFDLTANGAYSLSEASRQSVATLSEPLTINVFFTKNLPAPYNNIERYLRDLLEEFGSAFVAQEIAILKAELSEKRNQEGEAADPDNPSSSK